MSILVDAVQDYCGSEHFLFLDSDLKVYAEYLLAHWAGEVGDGLSDAQVLQSLKSVGQLDVPVESRKAFPNLLREFLSYLSSTGRFPGVDRSLEVIDEAEDQYVASFRDDGSMRGETVRKQFAKVGRNDPCPCGSGHKFKKCCIGLIS
ncbi:MAG: SEC-C metal-binding domain-containing protein [Candidatus Latescibacteria bacterium]|nr:SEC-C metal-binding domain-containing protein [Candidatus Latescibacterota bacterium]